jgi:hypothetical protein
MNGGVWFRFTTFYFKFKKVTVLGGRLLTLLFELQDNVLKSCLNCKTMCLKLEILSLGLK